MQGVSRRTALAGVLVAGLSACSSDVDGVEYFDGTLTSGYWPGQRIRWRLAVPSSARRPPLVIALHGKGGNADAAFGQVHVDDHIRRTGLAVASIDGGNHYWHRRRSGVDPGAVVLHAFIPLMRRRTGYDGKLGLIGWSMGGYGALLLATQLGARRAGAVVGSSAALWTSPGLSAPGAFDDREDFLAHDVFARVGRLAGIPVRLDVGRDDPFVRADRTFARALPSTQLTVDDGGHTGAYWAEHAGKQMDWIAAQLR